MFITTRAWADIMENCKYCGIELCPKYKKKIDGTCRNCEHRHHIDLDKEKYFGAINGRKSFADHRFFCRMYRHAKERANKDGYSWELSLSQFRELRSSLCHFCGKGLNPVGICLARNDNNLGYSVNNVVPCCKACTFQPLRSKHG